MQSTLFFSVICRYETRVKWMVFGWSRLEKGSLFGDSFFTWNSVHGSVTVKISLDGLFVLGSDLTPQRIKVVFV